MKIAQRLFVVSLLLSILLTGVRAQIILTEIMFNPIEAELPAYSYIEIYNKGSVEVPLQNYKLQVANTRMPLLARTLAPNSYMLLVEPGAEFFFQSYGALMPLAGWRQPGRTTGTIRLLGPNGEIIDELRYRNNWITTADKRAGGWSLERISPHFLCNTARSWGECIAPKGGTPGGRNSIWDEDFRPDLGGSVEILSPTRLKLGFGQRLQFSEGVSPVNFLLSQVSNRIVQVEKLGDSLIVDLAIPLRKDTEEKLRLLDFPCCGLLYEAELILFDASALVFQDLIINEVLFNPKSAGAEFVEIYNRSGKTLNLQGLSLGNRIISSQLLLMGPDEFRVLTRSKELVKKDYPSAVEDCLLLLSGMPRYANESGEVLLRNEKVLLDSFRYTSSMHQPFLQNVKGISLERRGSELETNVLGSFGSAAVLAGGATPGYANSNYVEKKEEKNKVFLHSRTFSPDGDGFEDYLVIGYAFSLKDPMLNISIYDDHGRIVNRLIRNESAGRQGEILWDGRDSLGHVCPAGIYVCYAEIYGSTGHFQSFKQSFILVKPRASY